MSCRERWRQECLLGRHARLDTMTWYLTMVEARNWLPKPVSRSPEEMDSAEERARVQWMGRLTGAGDAFFAWLCAPQRADRR